MQPVEISLPVRNLDKTIRVALSKASSGAIILFFKNRYVFRDLSHLSWSWEIVTNRSTTAVAAGTLSLSSDLEAQSVSINLDNSIENILNIEKSKTTIYGNSFYLNICGSLNKDFVWAKAGHALVFEQFPLEFFFDKETTTKPKSWVFDSGGQNTGLSVTQDDTKITVFRHVGSDVNPHVVICKKTGSIMSVMSPKGCNLLSPAHGIVPQYTRATTDNDRGGMERMLNFMYPDSGLEHLWTKFHGVDTFSYHTRWKMVGLDQAKPLQMQCKSTKVIETEGKDKVDVEAILSLEKDGHQNKEELIRQTMMYHILRDGRVQVSTHVILCPRLQECVSLPRVGMSLVLDPSLYHIQYFGRGPFENYEDRKAASYMGVHETTPKDMAYHYIFPSENGNRSDCEWVAMRNDRGEGVCFAADGHNDVGGRSRFHFSAQLHSPNELHQASHTCDLEHRENGKHAIDVNLDHRLMGIGGDVR